MAKQKPGKYDHVVGGLAPLPPQDAGKQAKVDEMKALLKAEGTTDALAVAKFYVRVRAEKARLERELKAIEVRIEAATQMLILSQDQGEEVWGKYGVRSNALRLEDGTTIRVEHQVYGQVKDKEAFRLWCIKNGYEQLLQLWPTLMSALVKERAAAGEPYPDGCEAFRKDAVKLVGAKEDE